MTQKGKENILKKIRQALENPVPLPYPEVDSPKHFEPFNEDLAVLFAEEFTKLTGRFSFCSGIPEMERQLAELFTSRGWSRIYYATDITGSSPFLPAHYPELAHCDASVTGCEYLVARTGSILLSSSAREGRTASVYAPVHICIAFTSQLVHDISDAINNLSAGEIPSFFTIASGPSRTADIEKTLVTGVHGPKEVFCFLVENQM